MAPQQDRLTWPEALAIPGFASDAIPFALRAAIALVLAYAIAFYAQVQPASTAGVCVGILSQPSAGMSLSKAWFRMVGTVLGCIVALVFIAAFPQNRTMLLLSFAVWMGLCAGASSLLRDFRAYGAALCGYTVAIIAVGVVDDPSNALVSALDRSAAIAIGIGSVLVVNLLLGGSPALGKLVSDLHAHTGTVRGYARTALKGHSLPDPLEVTKAAGAIAALRTDATYAAVEQSDGRSRSRAARFAVAALLTSLNASRVLALALHGGTSPVLRRFLDALAAELDGGPPAPAPPEPADPAEALVLDRATCVMDGLRDASEGVRVTEFGGATLPFSDLRNSQDWTAAVLSGLRTLLSVGAASVFSVLAGWPGATLTLVQQSAFVGLLGAAPQPLKASMAFLLPLPPVAILVGLVNFLVLPLASGFVPFAILAGLLMFLGAITARQDALAPYAPATLIYVTLLFGPSNQETFDLGSYLNTVLQLHLAILFVFLAFFVLFPVSPSRRLNRVAASVAAAFERARRGRDGELSQVAVQSLLYDRLGRALLWMGRPTPNRKAFVVDLSRVGEAGLACHRAEAAFRAMEHDPAVAPARAVLASDDPVRLRDAAAALMAASDGIPARKAAAALAELALLHERRPAMPRFLRLVGT